MSDCAVRPAQAIICIQYNDNFNVRMYIALIFIKYISLVHIKIL